MPTSTRCRYRAEKHKIDTREACSAGCQDMRTKGMLLSRIMISPGARIPLCQVLVLGWCKWRIEHLLLESQVLDECANEHAGMQAEERPIIGVRGQRKDLARVAKLIQVRAVPIQAILLCPGVASC
jgi:hypothetical protein